MTEKMPCPKCRASSGDDWEQCKGSCPIPGSPHYTPAPEEEVVGDPVLWKDRPDEWTDAILAVHPVNSTDPERHNRFALAMKMVGNRHGKYELVGLVHWLLTRLDAASPVVAVGREAVFDAVQDAVLAVVGGQETSGSASARAADAILAALGTKATNTGREG